MEASLLFFPGMSISIVTCNWSFILDLVRLFCVICGFEGSAVLMCWSDPLRTPMRGTRLYTSSFRGDLGRTRASPPGKSERKACCTHRSLRGSWRVRKDPCFHTGLFALPGRCPQLVQLSHPHTSTPPEKASTGTRQAELQLKGDSPPFSEDCSPNHREEDSREGW